jgi:Trk-type K+ transport system membrane component
MLVKLWLTVCMLAGRLEFYAILSLVLPTFWRQ